MAKYLASSAAGAISAYGNGNRSGGAYGSSSMKRNISGGWRNQHRSSQQRHGDASVWLAQAA